MEQAKNVQAATIQVQQPIPATRRTWRTGAAAGTVITLSLIAAAAYALYLTLPGRVRIAPINIAVHSSATLPPEVRALEAQTAPNLFDRDTTTAHIAYADQSIDAQLESPSEIQAIKIYGPSPYLLTVQAQQNGAWATINGLDKLKLGGLAAGWNTIQATQPTTTGALRFNLTLPAGNAGGGGGKGGGKNTPAPTAGGIPEIEIWATGEHALLNGAALVAAMPPQTGAQPAAGQPKPPAQARAYPATPATAVVGQGAQTFTVTLDRPAARFKRAWLTYETWGLAHWVSPVRRINGLMQQGGAFTFSGSDWTTVSEPVHPDWLKPGKNTLTYSLPPNLGGSYSVRNARIVAELDDGNNFIARATTGSTGNKGSTETDAPQLLDGDLTTGWSPYNDPHNKGANPALTVYFDRPTQLDSVNLNLLNALGGTLSVDLRVGGQWQSAGLSTINGKKLTTGWNQLTGLAAVAADALRITFQSGAGSAGEIREISASGSGTGTSYAPAISVAYPDAGQFYGRQAYIRGYLTVPDNSTATVPNTGGPAVLTIGGKTVPSTDGSFGVLVAKDDVGYANQADGDPWQVEITAQYPDGQKLSQTVRLTQANDASRAHGQLPNMPNPGLLAEISGGDASLEIGPDALDKPLDIKITALAEKDLPALDPGMTNVTPAPHRGYRFTPHGAHFKKDIKVTIPYDPALIPAGLAENDIKTFYFDTGRGHWVELARHKIDNAKHRLTSLTNHFTDMINATLTVPDHPETAAFNATQMKDIKAADPGAGINLIEPPKPNNMGDARLSYPIEIPGGRQGMQPQLAISYNSSGGNGWLGLGWDLSVPSISIDTRWGVPRYDGTYETETYTLNGEMLTPVAHRGPLQKRTDNTATWKGETVKIYHTRIESQFRKIIRHGTLTDPTSYWWEVIDKNGTRNYYGGDGAKDPGSTLGGTKGIYRWALRQTVDTHGNKVNYSYAKVDRNEASCATAIGVGGCQLYISEIGYTYTTQSGTTPLYTVDFIRDSKPGTPSPRQDVAIDERGGFKQVTDTLLTKINVNYNGTNGGLVRSYKLNYNEPGLYGDSRPGTAFNKTLLSSIVQYGKDGTSEFNRHTFNYFDDARKTDGTYNGFATALRVDSGSDHLEYQSELSGKKFPYTALGGTHGTGHGMDGYVGIGLGGPKTITVGVGFNSSEAQSTGNNAFVDVDGDGLPDKVFITDSGSYYRPNTTASGAMDRVTFFTGTQPKPVPGFAPPSDSESSNDDVTVQAFAVGATANQGNPTTRTRDMSYLADINGDGLVDIVSHGTVLFSTAKSTGVAGFSGNSYDTEVPLGNVGGSVDPSVLPSLTNAARTSFETKHPLMDNVRRWVAPYDGTVSVGGGVKLVDVMNDPRFTAKEKKARSLYTLADGVRVSIQHNDTELWATPILATDFTVHQPSKVNAIPVKKGDRLYFRVNSVYDGVYDQVTWSPTVDYIDSIATPATAMTYKDVNSLNAYHYQAGDDFVYSSRPIVMSAPYTGTMRLSGLLNKTAATTDDVTLRVTITNEVYNSDGTVTILPPEPPVLLKKLAWDMTGQVALQEDFKVNQYSDQYQTNLHSDIKIEFVVDSPVDLSALSWGDITTWVAPVHGPQLYYTEAYQLASSPTVPASAPAATTDPNTLLPPGGATTPMLGPDGQPIVIPAKQLDVYNTDGTPKYKVQVKYDTDIYTHDHLTAPQQKTWTASKDGMILLTPWITLKPPVVTGTGWFNKAITSITPPPTGQVVITAKRRGALLAKQIIQITNGQIDETTQGYSGVQIFRVKKGDEIFFDASMRDPNVESQIDTSRVDISYASDTPWQVPITDNANFAAHLEGHVPTYNPIGNILNNPPPPDGRAMYLIRKGDSTIIYSQLIDFSKTPVVDIPMAKPVTKGEKWYFDIYTISPSVTVTVNNAWAQYTAANNWTAPYTGQTSITPVLNLAAGAPDGTVTLAVLQNGTVIGQQNYTVTNGALVADSTNAMQINVSAGQILTFAYSTANYPLSSYLQDKGAVSINYLSTANKADLAKWTTPQAVGSSSFTIAMPTYFSYQTAYDTISHYRVYDALFGYPYRGWSMAGYNGGSGQGALPPINETKFALSSNKADYQNPNYIPNAWFAMPEIQNSRWTSLDDRWWTSPAEASASRYGLDNIYDPQATDYTVTALAGSATAMRPPRMSQIDQSSFGYGFVLTQSQSTGTSNSQMDILDMNGDRYPDIVGPSSTQYTWADGTLFDTNAGAGPARGTTDNQTSYGLSVGVPLSKQGATSVILGMGDKNTGESSSITLGGGKNAGSSSGNYDLIDVNGDGLPDRVTAVGGGLQVQYNNGYGFDPNPETWTGGQLTQGTSSGKSLSAGFSMWNGIVGGGISVSEGHNYTNTTLMDINGDGLTDVVSTGASNGHLSVMLNTGAGFTGPVDWPGALNPYKSLSEQTPGPMAVSDGASTSGSESAKVGYGIGPFFGITISFSVGANRSETVSQPSINYSDINGDGFVDAVITAKDSEMHVALNQINRTNLLQQVNRPLGATIALEYQRTGNTYAMPQSRLVMSQVTVNDGHSGDGADMQKTAYTYGDGHYDRYERDFYGFKTVTEKQLDTAHADAVYRNIINTYLNGNYYDKGLEAEEQTFDGGGNIYLETLNHYSMRDVINTANKDALPELLDGSANAVLNDRKTYFPMLVEADRNFYEGGTQGISKGTNTRQEYDALGNVTKFTDAGDQEIGGNAVVAEINYTGDDPTYQACQDSYIVGMPTTIVVKDTTGKPLRSRTGKIGCDSANRGELGSLTQLSQMLDAQSAAVTDLAYNDTGTLAKVTGPANNWKQRYFVQYAYDTEVATYVASVTDSFNYTSGTTYNYAYGKPLTSTDLNGNIISYAYDKFGRTETVKGPYEQQGSGNQTLTFAYHPEAATPYATTLHLDVDAKGKVQTPIETVLFTDGIKRVLQTKKTASIDINGTATPKMTVSGHNEYDAMGRAIQQYYPVEEPLGQDGVFNTQPDTTVPPTYTSYDVLDRTVQTTMPDKTVTAIAYDFDTDRNGATQFHTKVTDANGKIKETYRDIRELITSVKEHNRSAALWTSYTYDPLKEIIQVTDAKGNLTTATYDNLGRRTTLSNPDTGTTKTVYDTASNVVQKITANLALSGKAINYNYDYNRLTNIVYPDNPGNDVAYTYGDNTAQYRQKNQIGRLVKVTDASGSEEREYGKLGETIKEIRTIASHTQGKSANSPEIYTTQYKYDTFGRILTLILPDTETVTYTYDTGGNLASFAGSKTTNGAGASTTPYLQTLLYDKFEQRTYLKLGNGVETHYTYDQTSRRLNNLMSQGSAAGKFQNLNYSYDNVGNIMGLANDTAIPAPSGMGGPTNQTFGYDDLYRLTTANGKFSSSPNKTQNYTLAMGYDDIHNIVRKTQADAITNAGGTAIPQKATTYDWNYAYAGAQPHAPTHIGNRTFTYDADGNQLGWRDDSNGTRRIMLWDEENRISEIDDNGERSKYTYDNAGQRVIKVARQGETVYVNQYYVVRNRSIVSKHFFAGASRIATRMVMGTAPGNNFHGAGTNGTGGQGAAQATHGKATQGNQGNQATQVLLPPGEGLGRGKHDKAEANAEGATNLPGNSEAGLENALASGQGNKYGIYKHLEKEGDTVNASGEIVAAAPGSGTLSQAAAAGQSDFTYYYHSDHLGSTGYVTDANGKLYEHLEYFPFGETWVQEHSNILRTPYLFTGKEYDQETGLYYFGARYYDPRTSVWQSADSILGKYLPGTPHKEDEIVKLLVPTMQQPLARFDLPGLGGIFNPVNLAMYSYVGHNPLRYVDPDGNQSEDHGKLWYLANANTLNKDQGRDFINKFVLSRGDLPVTHELYSRAILGYTKPYIRGPGSTIANAMMNDTGSYANQTIPQRLASGKKEGSGGGTAWSSEDLQLSIGFSSFSWKMTNYDKKTGVATVSVTVTDLFDFNAAPGGERGVIAERLNTIGRSAGLSSFDIKVQYELKVKVNNDALAPKEK